MTEGMMQDAPPVLESNLGIKAKAKAKNTADSLQTRQDPPAALPFGPPDMGRGMHMGPGHPYFSRGLRNPELGRGGARWDPIAPQGLEGWSPDDFTRGQWQRQRQRQDVPPVHPDLMQPGPGRGTDFDHMFG
jgi:proteasome inhibitor subunit 1 (PI31)